SAAIEMQQSTTQSVINPILPAHNKICLFLKQMGYLSIWYNYNGVPHQPVADRKLDIFHSPNTRIVELAYCQENILAHHHARATGNRNLMRPPRRGFDQPRIRE